LTAAKRYLLLETAREAPNLTKLVLWRIGKDARVRVFLICLFEQLEKGRPPTEIAVDIVAELKLSLLAGSLSLSPAQQFSLTKFYRLTVTSSKEFNGEPGLFCWRKAGH
jgi:hypothetical protein